MALNADHLRFVLLAHGSGVRFDRPLMIGRQEVDLHASALGRVLAAAGFQLNEDAASQLLLGRGRLRRSVVSPPWRGPRGLDGRRCTQGRRRAPSQRTDPVLLCRGPLSL